MVALSVHRSAPRWAESRSHAAEAIAGARRVLLCLRYGIGDTVLELPAMAALRSAAPRARVVALGARPAVELLAPGTGVDEVVALQDLGFRHAGDRGSWLSRRRLRRWLDGHLFDVILDGKQMPLGVRRVLRRRPELQAEGVPWEEEAALARGEGAARAIAAGVEGGWGIPVPEPVPELQRQGDDRAWAGRFLARLGWSGRRPLALVPVASHSLKRWPLERYLEAARRASAAAPRPVLVFVGPEEGLGRRARALAADLPLEVFGVEKLHRTAAVLGRCAAVAGNDTGLLHVAGACGVPVVGVFGPTDPEVYLPRGRAPALAVGGRGISCPYRRPGRLVPPACWTSAHCLIGGESCVDRVRIDATADAIRRVLESGPSPSETALSREPGAATVSAAP